MGNMLIKETSRFVEARRAIERALPPTWEVNLRSPRTTKAPRQPDALLSIEPPLGVPVTFAVEAKRSPLSIDSVLAQVRGLSAEQEHPVVLVTTFANRTLRSELERLGVSYADSTGWLYLRDDSRGFFVRAEGAARGPRDRTSTATVRLNGASAGRVVEELLLAERSTGVRDLAKRATVSPGTVSKVLPTLVSAGAIDRDDTGAVTRVRKRVLLDRWTLDYDFGRTNKDVRYLLFPRGVDRLVNALVEFQGLAITGVTAAQTYLRAGTVSVVPALRVSLYAADPDRLARDLRLTAVDPGVANCIIARPSDPRVLAAATQEPGKLPAVSLPRVLADLMTTPGRESLVADQLMEQLARSDDWWAET